MLSPVKFTFRALILMLPPSAPRTLTSAPLLKETSARSTPSGITKLAEFLSVIFSPTIPGAAKAANSIFPP